MECGILTLCISHIYQEFSYLMIWKFLFLWNSRIYLEFSYSLDRISLIFMRIIGHIRNSYIFQVDFLIFISLGIYHIYQSSRIYLIGFGLFYLDF